MFLVSLLPLDLLILLTQVPVGCPVTNRVLNLPNQIDDLSDEDACDPIQVGNGPIHELNMLFADYSRID